MYEITKRLDMQRPKKWDCRPQYNYERLIPNRYAKPNYNAKGSGKGKRTPEAQTPHKPKCGKK
jgi:hypothetical protein